MVIKHGRGWLTDFPDFRDYTPYTKKINSTFKPLGLGPTEEQPQPKPEVDNRQWCSPIKNQGELSSCTAFAAVGMYEYLEKKIHNKFLEGSELFVYKLTRYLMHTRNEIPNATGDTGAFIRSALGALVYFGVPPAESYPYSPAKFDHEPPQTAYILAQSYQVTEYFRLDSDISNPQNNIDRVKRWVTLGFPVEFGFTCYRSALKQAETNGGSIPFPADNDTAEGGHAVMICGNSDSKTIVNKDNGVGHVGAFLIRNSWGPEFGEGGYGWLPYHYVLSGHGLAQDFWTIVKSEFIDKDAFHW